MFRSFHVVFAIAVVLVAVFALEVRAEYPSKLQERATILQESGGNTYAVGDKCDRQGRPKPSWQWSYGSHQIGWRAVADVNRKFGTNYKAEDCLGNEVLSSWIYREYCNMYGTEKAIGRKPTDDDFSGIWNGGPQGWKSRMTIGYRCDVRAKRNKLGR